MPTPRKRRSPTLPGAVEAPPEPPSARVRVDPFGVARLLGALHGDDALVEDLSRRLDGALPDLRIDFGAGRPALSIDRRHFDEVSSFVKSVPSFGEHLDLGEFFACDPNDKCDICWGQKRST